MGTTLVPAAEYVRMSTDQQEYSIRNQQDRIRLYAVQHGFNIVRTYADPGRSGLTIRERKGLAQLLTDVLSGSAPFKAICVYDVSRWGRFQDSDESAHYEFLCRKAGVPIHYCAEQFVNDGTMSSAMFKALKRTMAAEYSRELSSKMSAAKRRFAALGYRQGGTPGYGFRRLVVTADRTPRRVLQPFERKPFSTDRMTLGLGPKEEVATVRRIFNLFIAGKGRVACTEIAAQLNREKVPYLQGRRWTNQAIRDMLGNPKYMGMNVWRRTTRQLHTPARFTLKKDWVTAADAFPVIIDAPTFKRAQHLLKMRAEMRVKPDELLRQLRRVLREHGNLRKQYLRGGNGTFSASTFIRVFGGMKQAYELIGYKYRGSIFSGRQNALITERLRNEILKQLLELFPGELIGFRLPNAVRRTSLLLDGQFKLFVWIAKSRITATGKEKWFVQPPPRERHGLTLICTLTKDNARVRDFYLYPALHLDRVQYTFGSKDPLLLSGARLDTLSELPQRARDLLVQHAIPVPALTHENWRKSTLEDQLAGRLQPDRNLKNRQY